MRLRRRTARILIVTSIGLTGLWGFVSSPATTRQGVNFEVSTRNIPLYVKAIDFLHRHYHYQLLASEMTHGLRSDRERVLAVFEWTRQNIRRTPKGFPIVDDHVWDIIIRGYGLDDQMADVFTTLATYGGIPAFWTTFKVTASSGGLVLSFAQVDGSWRVFDVARGFVFRNVSEDLATPEELGAHPQLVIATAGNFPLGDIPYPRFFEQLSSFQAPRVLRARLHQPWPRFCNELRGLFGRWQGRS